MKRSPIHRHRSLRVKTRLRRGPARVSDSTPQQVRRRALEAQRREDVRPAKLAKDPFCQLRVTASCQRQAHEATDCHEIVRRSQGGSILDDYNLLSACSECHLVITVHPLFAECIGVSLPSWVRRSEDTSPAYLLSTACRENWYRNGWDAHLEPFWTSAEESDVRASIEAARRDAGRL